MNKIIKGAKIYFEDNQDLQIMFASPDGQYFFDNGTCSQYCTNNNLSTPIFINRSDVYDTIDKIKTPKKKTVKNGLNKKSNNK